MPDLYCGNCGNAAKSLANCGHCHGPVFDLGTAQGVIDCRTYRSLRSEGTERVSNEYVALAIVLGSMAISLVLTYAGREELGDFVWPVVGLVSSVSAGLVYWYYRWTRGSKECLLDARLARPDPFHDPSAPEPRRRVAP